MRVVISKRQLKYLIKIAEFYKCKEEYLKNTFINILNLIVNENLNLKTANIISGYDRLSMFHITIDNEELEEKCKKVAIKHQCIRNGEPSISLLLRNIIEENSSSIDSKLKKQRALFFKKEIEENNKTLEQVGKENGLSKQRVHQIINYR